FDESMAQMCAAEDYGFDAVWLAEIHFQQGRSVLSSPLVVASAIAGRTRRVKIGIAVQVLPLSHPLHLAEDVATLDHLCKGRLDFGVGRSGLPAHYHGYNIPYSESRERFQETLEILLKAWTQERFSHDGKYYQFRDVCITPKPFQKPHPPLRVAATTAETYPMVGRMGRPLFIAVRTTSISDLSQFIGGYHAGWREAGHPGRGSVGLIVPVYVADSARRAREEPEASTLHFYRSIAEALARGGTNREEAARLGRMSYDEILGELAVYGTPEAVTDRLLELREALGFSTLSVWMNVGGRIPHEQTLHSMRLFAERVGTYYFLQAPPAVDHAEVIQREIEQMVWTEELGFDSIWLTEHHFIDYGLSVSPAVLAAAAATRTRRVRIGQAAAILPFHDPIRLAEELAIVDILSEGRLDVGVGRGNRPVEFEGYRVPQIENRERFEECLAIMLKAWTLERFAFEGRHFKIPEVRVIPKPLQRPHPPIYVVCTSPDTIEATALRGVPMLNSILRGGVEQLARSRDTYVKACEKAGRTSAEIAGLLSRWGVSRHV